MVEMQAVSEVAFLTVTWEFNGCCHCRRGSWLLTANLSFNGIWVNAIIVDAGLEDFTTTPARFFVNIISQIQWHLDWRVLRTSIRGYVCTGYVYWRISKIGGHCASENRAELEDVYEYGTRIMLIALDKQETEGDIPIVVLFSYEL